MQKTLDTESWQDKGLVKREMGEKEHQLLCPLRKIIEDAKGMHIKVLDIQKKNSFAEYVILAEGYVSRHVVSMAYDLSLYIKTKTKPPLLVEGAREGGWAVLSYETVLIHLLTPEVREYYQLEQLYVDAVDLFCTDPFCREV